MTDDRATTTRRTFLGAAGAGVAAASLGVAAEGAYAQRHESAVRLGTITAVQIGGLLDELLVEFTRQSGYRVTVATGVDAEAESPAAALYQKARAGELDIVVSHWGVTELGEAERDRVVRRPVMFAANCNGAFIVPPSDPAGVRDAADPVEAFRRIAQHRSPFVVSNAYTAETLWNAVGRPDKQGWYLDLGLSGRAAVKEAAKRGGYSIWGLRPFLASQQQEPIDMQPRVFQDSLLQRVISSAVVEPGWRRRVNLTGALALQRYLVDPATQARIRMFRHPGFDHPVIWPGGHHNGEHAQPASKVSW